MVRPFILRVGMPLLLCIASIAVWQLDLVSQDRTVPIRVGVLHSTTGTMAASEAPLIQAVEMAIKELNDEGGLLGRKIETVVVNPNSDPLAFAALAESLILRDQVDAIFGCWTSSSRKHVRPVMEKYDSVLFYPVQYEGLESSPNIVYTGSNPNQQILPALSWAKENLGQRFYVVGSDYVFPRVAGVIIRDHLVFLGAELAGESYIMLGDEKVSSVVNAIKAAQPDVIINTLNGSTNQAFFKELRLAGISAADVPTISFSVSESELPAYPSDDIAGDYLAWSYFQCLDTAQNQDFTRRYREFSGNAGIISDPMVASYFGVKLWASAVVVGRSPLASDALAHLPDRSFAAPAGLVYLDHSNHAWLPSMIGKIGPAGDVSIVWQSASPIRPVPFPFGKTNQEWTYLLDGLQAEWNGQWQNSLRVGG